MDGSGASTIAGRLVDLRMADLGFTKYRGGIDLYTTVALQPEAVRGVVAHSVGGAEVETAPCDMLLGNAILHVARLDVSVCTTAAASIVAEGITLNCEDCRRLALKYGDKLEVRE
ncbi:hypothetical protein [Rhizobium ruizarguesonis]